MVNSAICSVEIAPAFRFPFGRFHLLTSFDTLLYYCVESGELRHGEVVRSPRNLTLSRTGDQAHLEITGLDLADGAAASARTFLGRLAVRNAGLGQAVALQHDRLFMSARPAGDTTFGAGEIMPWEVLRLVRPGYLDSDRYWRPSVCQGGTELMVGHLLRELGDEVQQIKLWINGADLSDPEQRKHVVWFHNEPEQGVYHWCRNAEKVGRIARFVFVSEWQRRRFLDAFGLPEDRCVVIHNAIDPNAANRPWPAADQWRWRCAYISAPFRGLSVLLDAWGELSPANAELHIWSGKSLWALEDTEFNPLWAAARNMPNVHYHRIAPNTRVRAALRDMHFLTYPCTYDETFCLSMVEAMSSGCRVIAPSRAALPEIASGFARMYSAPDDHSQHARAFITVLADELANPWRGNTALAERQQEFCRLAYSWKTRADEWRRMIRGIAGSSE